MKLIHIYHLYPSIKGRPVDYLGTRLSNIDCDVILVVMSSSFVATLGRWRIKLKTDRPNRM